MAEPALAALCRPAGETDWFRAQWGGSRRRLAAVFDPPEGNPYAPLLDAGWERPRDTHDCEESGLSVTVDCLRFETVYHLSTDGVAVFVPVWAGLPPAVKLPPTAGALVGVGTLEAVDRLRASIRLAKALLNDRVAAGDCSPESAVVTLWNRLGGRELVATGALRELLRATPPNRT